VFHTVLVANRGEIAVRVIRTLRSLGIRSVAVFSDVDAGARHVLAADLAVRIGPAPARESYLDGARILAAARDTGAQAVHPGYGFLAENAAFARACAAAGVVFVGPPPHAVEVMGDKIAARRAVAAAGVPVVPGRAEPDMSDADLADAAADIGYPVLIKPSAGGGGKGMRLVAGPADLPAAAASARREAVAAFGDGTLFVERFVQAPRHIEVQVLADTHGHVIHLGERECSLQRRHQKIVEEAPSPLLCLSPAVRERLRTAAVRERLGNAAVAVAAAVGYTGAGTVEFIVGAERPEEFFFMEMNTRLQVEHAVTELVTGVDLVAEQLRVAAGEPLRLTQAAVRLAGHAVEARIYAEDPAHDFLPTGGTVLALAEPVGDGVRVDSGILAGTAVPSSYDPMLAKVAAWGPDRDTALARLDRALADTVLLGVTHNIGFLRRLLAHPDVRAGRLDTGLVERHLETLTGTSSGSGSGSGGIGIGSGGVGIGTGGVPADALAVFGLAQLLAMQPAGPVVDPWDIPSGWRPGKHAWLTWVVRLPGGGISEVAVRGTPADAAVRVAGGEPAAASIQPLGPVATSVPLLQPTPQPFGPIDPVDSALRTGTAGESGVDQVGPAFRTSPVAGSVRPLGPIDPTLGTGPTGNTGGGVELLVILGGRSCRWQVARAPAPAHAPAPDPSPARPPVGGGLPMLDGVLVAGGVPVADAVLWVGTGGSAWPLVEQPPGAGRTAVGAAGSGQARSPMPGTVTEVHIAAGARVAEGQVLVVVEAMKMEHAVPAPFAGYVKDVFVRPGDRVALDALLAVVDPTPDPDAA
jgi:acetyl-CoA/propionyl-CoA carboxylase biotin carboxyl carrier protein